MATVVEPMIKLEPGGHAPILSYNVPEPTAYSGRNFIEMKFPVSYFKARANQKPAGASNRLPVKKLDVDTIKSAVAQGMKAGFTDARVFPNVQLTTGVLRFASRPAAGMQPQSSLPYTHQLAHLDPDEVAAAMQVGKRLNIYKSLYGTLTYNYVPEPVKARPRLMLMETYQLSSFLGAYGAGRVIRTFTLLPGEKTRISVKSYARRATDAKSASSILDSFSQESADDFETSVQNEQSSKENYAESFEYNADAEANASWGWGDATVSGGVKGGSNAARETAAKNITAATQKHSAKASAKRDVQIDTSYEVKEETGEETSIEREIQNINLSRTLNFVFRQMNQEFVTLLHLVDVRVAFFNGFAESRREVSLAELDSLLDEVVEPARQAEVRQAILDQLQTVLDYQDEVHALIEEKALSATDKYLRVRRDLFSTYADPATGTKITVPGIILSAMKTVMRTEGVIVEALIGQGEALDGYAQRLQELEVQRRTAEVTAQTATAERATLVNTLTREGDRARADILAALTCPCGSTPEPFPVQLLSTASKADGDSQ